MDVFIKRVNEITATLAQQAAGAPFPCGKQRLCQISCRDCRHTAYLAKLIVPL